MKLQNKSMYFHLQSQNILDDRIFFEKNEMKSSSSLIGWLCVGGCWCEFFYSYAHVSILTI
jgi:hypothetical protein